MWPIRDLGGEVIGFGARKLFDDDDGPKYLNTPETPIYKKSQVLYGIDLARRDIAKNQQAVIVEGYTDVMACHLAGIATAVATCGTAFGDEHIKVLRRLLMDDDQFRGEVIFTFDGDAAGQKAALRAFEDDQRFVAQTFVAVEPTGLDPCDLRIQHGDAAVVALVDRRVPAVRVRHPVDPRGATTSRPPRAASPRCARPRRSWPRSATRRCARSTRAGWPAGSASTSRRSRRRCRRPAARPRRRPRRGASRSPSSRPRSRAAVGRPCPAPQSGSRRDPALVVEREALKCALQQPEVVADWYASVEESAFTHPTARQVHHAIVGRRLRRAPSCRGLAWIDAVLEASVDDAVRGLVRELAVEPLPAEAGQDARYAIGMISRLLELDASRRIDDLRGRLQRTDPVTQADGVPEVLRRPPRARGVPAVAWAGRPRRGGHDEDHAEAHRRGCPGAVIAMLGIGPGERVVAWGSGPGADADADAVRRRDRQGPLPAGHRRPAAVGPHQQGDLERPRCSSWSSTGDGGQPRLLRLSVEDARDLPAAVHDRVTASVLVSERVDLGDGAGALMVARRADDDEVRWTVVFDSGLDAVRPGPARGGGCRPGPAPRGPRHLTAAREPPVGGSPGPCYSSRAGRKAGAVPHSSIGRAFDC